MRRHRMGFPHTLSGGRKTKKFSASNLYSSGSDKKII